MLATELRIMRGPNMWSSSHNQLIVVKFDANHYSQFTEDQKRMIIDYLESNFKIRSDEETSDVYLFDCTLQLAAALQGGDRFLSINRPPNGHIYGLVEYQVEQAGELALRLAMSIIEDIGKEQLISFEDSLNSVMQVAGKFSLGPTTNHIIAAAQNRHIPVTMGPAGYSILGYGKNQRRISAAMTHNTSCIAVNIAGNKEHTKKFLESANIPTPRGVTTSSEEDLAQIAEKLEYPLVTKPFNGNQGRNVTCDITNLEGLIAGFRHAKERSHSVIIEKQIIGKDYRLLVIGNQFCAASLRLPAAVTGDGISTIAQLVNIVNHDKKRGNGHENILTKIKLDTATDLCLEKQGLFVSSVPAAGQQIFLKETANLSTGGTAEDCTDLIHPFNIALAEKVSRVIGLDICGIDIISADLSIPLIPNGGAVIEVNAAPGLRMHAFPSNGIAREVGKPIVDLMFDQSHNGRIPIVAITGTNGKTTTTRLMAQVASFAGHTVGFSSTDGIYIDGIKVQTGDCSGPQSAKTILHDTTVDFAVLECARGGIIRSGLGFDECDIAIVTNVAADHLGLKDIYTLEDLAAVKAVVPSAVKKDGWAILNAADDLTYKMKDSVKSNIALFCSDEQNANLQQHMTSGGTAIYTDTKQDVYIVKDQQKTFILNAAEIPITRNGKAGFMIENLLPVILAGHLSGFTDVKITEALKSFIPSPEETPGRINDFLINGVNVIVDYAHNPHGMRALADYLKNISARKIGIITGTGDRREEDIIEFGRIAANAYDEIIIRFDRDLRGRTKESIIGLLTEGIKSVNSDLPFQIIPDTKTAIAYAIENAEKESYVVICADNATYTVGLTKEVALQYST